MKLPNFFFSLLFFLSTLGAGRHASAQIAGLHRRLDRKNQSYIYGVTKLFVFGDSYADTGNIPEGVGDSWKPPYGITFPGQPSGRFSDGRVLTDYVDSQDLLGHLNKGESAPDKHLPQNSETAGNNTTAAQTLNPEYVKWKKADCLMRGWLIGSLSEESLGLVIGLDSAQAIWDALKGAYAQDSQEREFNLKQQVTYMRKEDNKSINDHIQHFKGLCDSLAAIGKPIPDSEKVYFLLTSLGPQYETFTITMLKPPRPSYTELVSHLQNLDQMRTWFASKETDSQHLAFYGQKPQQRSDNGPRFTSTGRGFQAQQARGQSGTNEQQRQVYKRMSRAEMDQYKTETCDFCGVQCHISKICWWNSKAKTEILPQALSALTLNNTIADTEWIMDTGATNHMTGKDNSTGLSERSM